MHLNPNHKVHYNSSNHIRITSEERSQSLMTRVFSTFVDLLQLITAAKSMVSGKVSYHAQHVVK